MNSILNSQNSNDLFPFFRFSLRYCMAPNEVNGPRISYIQSVYLIEEGKGKFCYDDHEVDLFPNVHVFLPSGKMHTIKSSKLEPIVFKCVFFEWNCRNRTGIEFRNDYLPEQGVAVVEDYIEQPAGLNIVEYTVLKDTREWNFLFNALSSKVHVYQPSPFPASLKIQGNFLLFLDYVLNIANTEKAFKDVRIDRIIKKIESMSRDFEDKNVEAWAAEYNLSRSYFHYLFKKQTGSTPYNYWIAARINRSMTDLIETNLTVTLIAEKHNFKSVHYYSKLFHKFIGTAPNEFRKRYRLN